MKSYLQHKQKYILEGKNKPDTNVLKRHVSSSFSENNIAFFKLVPYISKFQGFLLIWKENS